MRTLGYLRDVTEEHGGALPAALIVIVIVNILAGIVLSGLVMQHRFIQRDIDSLKARYAAEGAIFYYLSGDTLTAAESLQVTLPDSNQATIGAEFWGGYVRVTSTAKVKNASKTIQVMVGSQPDSVYDKAIVMGDTHSRLQLTGNTQINGDLLTGPLGAQPRAFKGDNFSGSIGGEVQKTNRSPLARYNSTYIEAGKKRLEKLLENRPRHARVLPEGRHRAAILTDMDSSVTIYSEGDLEFFALTRRQWPEAVTIISKGTIILNGDISLGKYSRFVSGSNIIINGNVEGEHGMFFARDTIRARGAAAFSGQLVAGKSIDLSGQVYLRYPSLLYMTGLVKDSRRSGKIQLRGEAVVDGMAVLAHPDTVLAEDRSGILIEEQATVRGALFNSGQTELHGRVLGSAITFQFYFYHSPTAYINWVKDATVNLWQRPQQFGVPLGYSRNKTYAILDWREL